MIKESFAIKGFAFQIPYKIQEIEKWFKSYDPNLVCPFCGEPVLPRAIKNLYCGKCKKSFKINQ